MKSKIKFRTALALNFNTKDALREDNRVFCHARYKGDDTVHGLFVHHFKDGYGESIEISKLMFRSGVNPAIYSHIQEGEERMGFTVDFVPLEDDQQIRVHIKAIENYDATKAVTSMELFNESVKGLVKCFCPDKEVLM